MPIIRTLFYGYFNIHTVSRILASTCRLGGPDMTRKAKSELFSALFKLHHLANWMYHQLEENEAKRSSLLPFGGDQIWICYRPPTAVVVVAVVHINDHKSKSNYFCSMNTREHRELDETRRMSLLPTSESNGKSSISRDMGSISFCRGP